MSVHLFMVGTLHRVDQLAGVACEPRFRAPVPKSKGETAVSVGRQQERNGCALALLAPDLNLSTMQFDQHAGQR